jgi:hypothetical protein
VPEAIQFSLFSDAPVDTSKEAKVKWSYSRRQTLNQCTRRYYYEYYGASARLATADPQKEDLRFLKTLSNRYLRSGDILHIAIRLFYKHGEDSSNWLVDWARRTYRADYEYSRGGPLPNEDYPPVMLLEFHYNHPDADALYTESENRLLDALQTFLTSPAYAAARYGGRCPSAKVEEWIFVEIPAFSARGKVDLAYPQNDEYTIVDWKTGRGATPRQSLQLAFYALWAVETQGYRPENVTLCRGQLTDGSLKSMAVTDRFLSRVRARIAQDLERMCVLDEYGREGIVGVFSPCGFSKVCRLCPYQGICSDVAI